MQSQPITTQHQLNCFIIENPIFSSSTPSALLIADTSNHIYKFSLDARTHKQGLDHTLQIDDHDLSHQDLISLLATDMQSTHYNSLDLSFRMDVQMAVLKCLCQIVEAQQIKAEVLTVLGTEGQLKLWAKLPNQAEYSVLSIQSQQTIQRVMDVAFDHSQQTNETNLVILQLPEGEKQLKVHRLKLSQSQSFLCLKEPKKSIQCHLADPPSTAKLVDKCRMVAIGNQLIGIYQQSMIELKGLQSNVKQAECGARYVLYGDGRSAWAYDRKQESYKCLVEDSNVVGLRFVDDRFFICLNDNPLSMLVSSVSGKLLWTVDLSSIQSPLLVQENSTSFLLQVLDREKFKVHNMTISSLLASMPQVSCPVQQQKVHASTATTLKHRLQILRTLEGYSVNCDHNSLLRYLQNCNNTTVLNDGLMLLHHRFAKARESGAKEEKGILTLGSLLLHQSKYESHLQNSLQALLGSCKRLKIQNKQEPKAWQECMKIIKEVLGSKKLRKLQQQQKNKRIFELAYELIHTANSHLLQYT